MSRTLCVGIALALTACGGEPPASAPLAPDLRIAQPATLEGLAKAFQKAQQARDTVAVGALGASVVPTSEELMNLVKPGPEASAFLLAQKVVGWPATSSEAKSLGASLFAPGEPSRTEVKTYSATTEEIAEYAKGGVAFAEFPGGMKRFAERVAAPGRVWWVAVCVAPGRSSGTKYSCFTRLGSRWLFLPKPWRSIARDQAPDAPEDK